MYTYINTYHTQRTTLEAQDNANLVQLKQFKVTVPLPLAPWRGRQGQLAGQQSVGKGADVHDPSL